MEEIYAACDWVIQREHLLNQHFTEFLDTATALNCELWIDWWAEMSGKPARRFVLQAPSQEAVRNLAEQAGVNLGVTEWDEVPYEYFLSVTKDGQVPSLQKMRSSDPQYFGQIQEGLLNLTPTDRN